MLDPSSKKLAVEKKWLGIPGRGIRTSTSRGTRKHRLLGETRPSSALQRHLGEGQSAEDEAEEGDGHQFMQALVASAQELELNSLVSPHNSCT